MKALLMLMFSTTVMAAPTHVEVVPSGFAKLDTKKELQKCQCKCKRRSNMTDLMDAKEFLEQELQKIEGQPEQTLN